MVKKLLPNKLGRRSVVYNPLLDHPVNTHRDSTWWMFRLPEHKWMLDQIACVVRREPSPHVRFAYSVWVYQPGCKCPGWHYAKGCNDFAFAMRYASMMSEADSCPVPYS